MKKKKPRNSGKVGGSDSACWGSRRYFFVEICTKFFRSAPNLYEFCRTVKEFVRIFLVL